MADVRGLLEELQRRRLASLLEPGGVYRPPPTADPTMPPQASELALSPSLAQNEREAAARKLLKEAASASPGAPEGGAPGILERAYAALLDMPAEQRAESMAKLDYLNVPGRVLGWGNVEPWDWRKAADAAVTLALNAPEIGMAAVGPPEQRRIYKLMGVNEDATVSPAFADPKMRYRIGEWSTAETVPAARRRIKAKESTGFHGVEELSAGHIDKPSKAAAKQNRQWVEATVEGLPGNPITYRDRPKSQGGRWTIAPRMRVDRVLTPDDIKAIRTGILEPPKKGAKGTPEATKQAKAIREYYKRGLMTSTTDLRGLPLDEAVAVARTEQHLQPNPKFGQPDEGYFLGGPRTFQSMEDVQKQRDFLDQYMRRDTRGMDWYTRYREGLSSAIGPPGTTFGNQSADDWNAALQGQFSAGVAPESEIQFALKQLNAGIAGRPETVARFSAQRDAFNRAVASGDWRQMQLGKKTGEYARLINPVQPPPGATGVNDFRHARNLGFTEPGGVPQRAGLSGSQHRYADYETALAVDRANRTALGGRTDWTGERLQAAPWVVQKAIDENARANKGLAKKQAAARKAGKPVPQGKPMEQSLIEANRTITDYFPKQTFFETYEHIPGSETGHLPGLLEADDAAKQAYSSWPVRGAPGGRDYIYGGTGIPGTGLTMRTEAPRKASGVYTNPKGILELNPAEAVPVHVSIKHEKGSQRIGDVDRELLQAATTLRGAMEAQNAMAGHMVFPKGKAGELTSLSIPKAGLLEKEQVRGLLDLGKEVGLPDISDVGSSVTMTRFGADPDAKQVRELSKQMKEGLGTRIREILPGEGEIRRVGVDSIYNDLTELWRQGPGSGAVTRQVLHDIGKTPQMRRAFSENPYLANAALDLIERDARYAGTYGKVRKDIQNFRRVIAEGPGWPDRLSKHLKKKDLALPSILLPFALAAGLVSEKDSESRKQSF